MSNLNVVKRQLKFDKPCTYSQIKAQTKHENTISLPQKHYIYNVLVNDTAAKILSQLTT